MWTSINKRLYIFMSVLLFIGVVVGIVFVVTLDESTKEILFLNINEMIQSNIKLNNILLHFISLASLFILSIFVIGAPLDIFFIFYNGFSIGFIISSLTIIFGIKGLLYGVIYVIISKLIFIILLMFFLVTLFKIVKNIIDYFIYKKNNKETIILLFKKALIFIALIVIFDVILYFTGAKIINIFNFLIN